MRFYFNNFARFLERILMGMPGKSVARLLLAAAAAAAAGLVAVDASYPVSSENSWVHLRGRKGTMLGRLVLNMPRVAPLALRGGGETVEFSVMCDKTAFGESVGCCPVNPCTLSALRCCGRRTKTMDIMASLSQEGEPGAISRDRVG
jgi:hypothetical protein